RRQRAEDFGDERRRLLVHLAARRGRDEREGEHGERVAGGADHQNMKTRPSRYASCVLSVAYRCTSALRTTCGWTQKLTPTVLMRSSFLGSWNRLFAGSSACLMSMRS